MPKTTRKPAPARPGKPATPSRAKRGDLEADQDTIRQAVEELGINRPYYTCRVVGSRLEFSLYGGDVVHWPAKPAPKPKRRQTRKERS